MPRHPTLRELRRAKSVPDRAGACWRIFKSVAKAAGAFVFIVGVVLIPGYLTVVGIWKLDKCNASETLDLPLLLVIYGTLLFFIALYVPCYFLGKSRAMKAREGNEISIEEDELDDDEIIESMPFRIVPISYYSFLFLAFTSIFYVYRVFTMYPERRFCDPLVYWTSFTISVIFSVIYCILLIIALYICIPAIIDDYRDRHPVPITENTEMVENS